MKIIKQNNPLIATIDIESYPAEVLMYGNTWEPVIVKIKRFQSILSFSCKINDKKTKYIALNKIKGYRKGDLNDKKLMIEISKMLQGIDYICGHNSDDFDIKIIKERIMFHRLPALPDITTLDTKKLYKKVSKLPNNKLGTISQFMGNGKKTEHSGTDLFIACGEGDKKAWRINEIYNPNDVEMTYADLRDVLPYVKLTNQQTVFSEDIQCSNPLCLSHNLTKSRHRRVRGGWKQQYQCQDCSCYTQSKKINKFDN